jgi:hypothetical protein
LILIAIFVPTAAHGQDLFKNNYAVVIGINKVVGSRLAALSYAENDAHSMAVFLERQRFRVTALYGSAAGKYAIIGAMTDLARRVTQDDRVLVFFAGHGYTEEFGGRRYGYLVPADGADDSAKYVSMEELRELSEKMGGARHQLFIIDACYGGLFGTRAGASGLDPVVPNYLKEVTRRPARQAITAGDGSQQVLDSGPDGHSLFTSALLEGLERGFADRRFDGYIVLPDLVAYLVRRATNAFQTPISFDLPGHGFGEFVFASPNKPEVSAQTSAATGPVRLRGSDETPSSSAPTGGDKQGAPPTVRDSPHTERAPSDPDVRANPQLGRVASPAGPASPPPSTTRGRMTDSDIALLEGTWFATYYSTAINETESLELSFDSQKEGLYLWGPTWNGNGQSTFQRTGRSISFQNGGVPFFEGELALDGESMQGQLKSNGRVMTVRFVRGKFYNGCLGYTSIGSHRDAGRKFPLNCVYAVLDDSHSNLLIIEDDLRPKSGNRGPYQIVGQLQCGTYKVSESSTSAKDPSDARIYSAYYLDITSPRLSFKIYGTGAITDHSAPKTAAQQLRNACKSNSSPLAF